jgi:cell filamentation protein
MIDETEFGHRFTALDMIAMHKRWLGGIYSWAGSYRSVNISKDGFLFAVPGQIPRLMSEFEAGPLRRFTPCRSSDLDRLSQALAVTHAELILIHPFREGNGRIARLLATLMAMQAGFAPLNFGGIEGRGKAPYIAAIHAAARNDYEPMVSVFRAILRRTLGRAG